MCNFNIAEVEAGRALGMQGQPGAFSAPVHFVGGGVCPSLRMEKVSIDLRGF